MNFEMIEAAAGRLKGHARVTPLLNSPFLDEIAGRRVWIKAECLQVTGSFKFRGGWSAVSAMEGEGGVLAYSSGNHAQGTAAAAQAHGRDAVIVMPADAPAIKVANTKAYGAEVVHYDRANESREEIGKRLAEERGLTLIRPYDEPLVIAGQGTTGLEIARQTAEVGVDGGDVIVCCGGGGLTSGIALALEKAAPSFRVRTAEPERFDDVARSLSTGVIQRNETLSGSICDAIVTPQPGELTFPIMNRLCGPGMTVSDEEALRAMALAFLRLKIVVEPGGAVALAAALFHGGDIEGEDVVVVVSGGNVDPGVFADAISTYGGAA